MNRHPHRNLRKVLFSSIVAIGFALSLPGIAAAEDTPAVASEPKAPSINVVAAGKQEMVATLTVTGTIVPRQEVAVGTDVGDRRFFHKRHRGLYGPSGARQFRVDIHR